MTEPRLEFVWFYALFLADANDQIGNIQCIFNVIALDAPKILQKFRMKIGG